MSHTGRLATLIKQISAPEHVHWGYPRAFVVLLDGDHNAARLLQRLWWWEGCTAPDAEGWVYKTDADWCQDLLLGQKAIRNATAKLLRAGLIEKKLRKVGIGPVNHFRVNETALLDGLKRVGDCSLKANSVIDETAITLLPKGQERSDPNGNNHVHERPSIKTSEETPLPPKGGDTPGETLPSRTRKPSKVRGSKFPSQDALEDAFAKFWTAYAKHGSRVDALDAFTKYIASGDLPDLLKAAVNYLAATRDLPTPENRNGLKFVKHAATFLRKDRWREWIFPEQQSPSEDESTAGLHFFN